MPAARDGMTWHLLSSFNAAEEILKDPDLKDVFKAAISNGCAIVEAKGE